MAVLHTDTVGRDSEVSRSWCGMSEAQKLDSIEDVVIDDGTFKYILIALESESGIGKSIVRGISEAEYHADVYERYSPSIEALGFDTRPLGGGRIAHNPQLKTLKVYGYSVGYGRADHSITEKILRTKYPTYQITTSNEGY